jgi:hypothetical protein
MSLSAGTVWKDTTTQFASPTTGSCHRIVGIDTQRSSIGPPRSLESNCDVHCVSSYITRKSPAFRYDITRWMRSDRPAPVLVPARRMKTN